MELRELVRLNSVAAQLIKHCSSPPLSEGPRGPMVSYFGTLTGFHSAPSQPIVSRRRERALDVLELEHGDGNVSHQVLRSGLSSNVLPSPHQWYFELCKLAKRVANDRLHQHLRDVSKQYRTTRSGLQIQACKA